MNSDTLIPETDSQTTDEFDELLEESFADSDEPALENEALAQAQTEVNGETITSEKPEASVSQDHKINGLINELRHTREELKACTSNGKTGSWIQTLIKTSARH